MTVARWILITLLLSLVLTVTACGPVDDGSSKANPVTGTGADVCNPCSF